MYVSSGLEAIKREFILKFKKGAMIGCLRTLVRKQPIVVLYLSLRLYSSLIIPQCMVTPPAITVQLR